MPLLEVTLRTIAVSAAAVAVASMWSIPVSIYIVERRHELLVRLSEAFTGIPTVLVGLLLYLLLCGRCPLAWTHLLYTPAAISLGEAILVTPVYVAFLSRGLSSRYRRVFELGVSLGGDYWTARLIALREAAPSLASAVIASWSRAAGELGVALLVGGNIAGYTRTLATSIALFVEMGEYMKAGLYGGVLAGLLALMGLSAWLVERLASRG